MAGRTWTVRTKDGREEDVTDFAERGPFSLEPETQHASEPRSVHARDGTIALPLTYGEQSGARPGSGPQEGTGCLEPPSRKKTLLLSAGPSGDAHGKEAEMPPGATGR